MKVVTKKEVEVVTHFCDVCKKNKRVFVCNCCEKDLCEADSYRYELETDFVHFCRECYEKTSEDRKKIDMYKKIINICESKIEDKIQNMCL